MYVKKKAEEGIPAKSRDLSTKKISKQGILKVYTDLSPVEFFS